MNVTRMLRSGHWTGLLILLVLGMGPDPVLGQPNHGTVADPLFQSGASDIRVYGIVHADLEEAAVLLGDLLPSVKIAIDGRTRRLIVVAEPHVHDEVARLLQEVVDAPIDTVAPVEAAEPSGRLIRIAWLVSSNEEIAGTYAVPPGLGNVAEELRSLGLENLRLAAQLTVAARLDQPFELSAQKQLTTPWSIEAQGSFEDGDPGHDRLRIGLRASTEVRTEGVAEQYRPEGARFQTSLAIPLDHPVVLATAPSGGAMTSVFVITVQAMGSAPVER